jgi:hypothetical protein
VGFCVPQHYTNEFKGRADFYLLHMYTVFLLISSGRPDPPKGRQNPPRVTQTLPGVVQTLPAGPNGRGYQGIHGYTSLETPIHPVRNLQDLFFSCSHQGKRGAEKLSNFAVTRPNLLVLHSRVCNSIKIQLLQVSK